MQFLQTSVSELIDHSDMEQTREVSQTDFTNIYVYVKKNIVPIQKH